MWHWIKWVGVTLSFTVALLLKHLFTLLILLGIGYAIVEWMYPELPGIDNFIKWYDGLSPNIQPQVFIGGVMVFGFFFHHLSSVATAKQKHVIEIKKTLAENITILSNQMCQVAIDTASYCRTIMFLKERIENAKNEEEINYWWDYSYEQCCEYGMKIDLAYDIQKRFDLLRSMHSFFYTQLGLEKQMECIHNVYKEFTFIIVPITNNTRYYSKKDEFLQKAHFISSYNLQAMKELAEECNIEMGRLSGGITGRLLFDIYSPTVTMLLILFFKPSIFVGEMKKNAGECFAAEVKKRRKAIEKEREERLKRVQKR